MRKYVELIRPDQWVKNLFIFLPLFFDRHLLDTAYLFPAGITFVAFCLMASSIYCLNDICDYEIDKLHPRKRKRPIASGAVRFSAAYVILFVLLFFSVALVLIFLKESGWETAGILLFYYVLNVGYCIKLKQIAIIDVFIIASGFVLRVLAGGISAHIHLTHWIILMTFLLALFLAFAKRRDDVILLQETGITVRPNIHNYNSDFMNQVLTILASVLMVCYIMYSVSDEVIARMGSRHVYLTVIFVLAGIIRYLQLALVEAKSGNPTNIFMKDRFIQACILLWIVSFLVIIYIL